jgi:hypothetical protein
MVSETCERFPANCGSIPHMQSQDELRRRVKAARVLADISQADMNAAGHRRGLGKHELGNAERGDIDIRQYHLPMLCEILGVPMSWFTEPRQVIVAQRAADYRAVLRDLLELLSSPPAEDDDPPIPVDLPGEPGSPQAPPGAGEAQTG